MSEIKPCPFCGSEPTSSNEFDDEVLFYGCTKDIDCPLYDAPFVNIANWNNRPIEDALNARIAELEEYIADLGKAGDSYVKKSVTFENKIRNLHKVIAKQQVKIQRQAENITTLLHLYTSGKRSKSHKKLREKYRLLKASFNEWKRGMR